MIDTEFFFSFLKIRFPVFLVYLQQFFTYAGQVAWWIMDDKYLLLFDLSFHS